MPSQLVVDSDQIPESAKSEVVEEHEALKLRRMKAYKKAKCGKFFWYVWFIVFVLYIVAIIYAGLGISKVVNLP